MTADVLARIKAAFMAVLQDNAQQIAIRRGGATLAPQTIRVAPYGREIPHPKSSGGLEATQRTVVVNGLVTLDIQPFDRLTWEGQLFEVYHVLPDRRLATMALARLVE